MRRFVLCAATIATLVGTNLVGRAQAQTPTDPNNAYELLFSRVLQNPGNPTLNKEFARAAEARGDLRLAFASLERVVLSSPGDTLAQAEFDRLRNKMMPAVTLVTVDVGATYASNPRQLPETEFLVNPTGPLSRGAPFSVHRPDDTTFNARVTVADERTLGGVRWRSLALAQGQFQADVSLLDNPTLAVASGPVFYLNPNLWMYVAGAGDVAWLDGDWLYDDLSVAVTFGGLFRGLTQTLTARYDWRDGNFNDFSANNAEIFDLEGNIVLSPSLAKGDLLYLLPRFEISQDNANPKLVVNSAPSSFGTFDRPLFPSDFTEAGGAVAYYLPLHRGRAIVGGGIRFYWRWYDESAATMPGIGLSRGDRRDTFIEPAAHIILPNFFGPSLDLRFDYRFEHNDSNATMTTSTRNNVVTIPFDFENHVAGVHVVGRF